MANTSVSSTLSRASTLMPFDLASTNAEVKLENALLSALGTDSSRLIRRTPEGLKFNTDYLTVAHRAAEELDMEPQLLWQKPWWQKVMQVVNDEISKLEVTYSSLEFKIDYALRETLPVYTIFTTMENPQTVIDYTAIYRAVEQQLDLPNKFLNQKKWKAKRTEIVNDQIKTINAANPLWTPTPILIAGTVSPQKEPFRTIPFPIHTNINANRTSTTKSNTASMSSTESLPTLRLNTATETKTAIETGTNTGSGTNVNAISNTANTNANTNTNAKFMPRSPPA